MFVDCLGTVRWFCVIVIIMFSANVVPVLQVGTYRINQVAAYCFTVPDALKLHYSDETHLSAPRLGEGYH